MARKGELPKTSEAFLARFKENQRCSGRYFETTLHVPCPFCAAPDFQVWRIIECQEEMQKVATCNECHRSGKTLLTVTGEGTSVEFVQTDGPAPPSYLMPPPRYLREPQYG